MKDTTVVICCAGMGTRLGIGLPKALVKVDGEPLIIHQLKMLKDFDDIRVVVGFQAEKIIEIVKSFRKDIAFVFNYDFEKTGPAESLCRALVGTRRKILSIGGDILINPQDLKKIIMQDEVIAYTDINSSEPVLINVENDKIVGIGKNGNYEWQGIVKIDYDRIKNYKSSKYIYEMIKPNLPINGLYVKSREIDNQDDYDNAIEFYKNGYK